MRIVRLIIGTLLILVSFCPLNIPVGAAVTMFIFGCVIVARALPADGSQTEED